MRKIILLPLIFTLLISQTEVSGVVSGNWTSEGSPYHIIDDVIVVEILNIEPGVEIIFDGYLNISVFNIAGQLVDVIHNGNMVAGYHQISWNASEVSSGLYIVKANDGINVVSQKVMLLK